MQKRAINKVLVIGRGEMHGEKNKTLDCEEMQSCIALLEEHTEAVLITNADSESMMNAVLDIPIYQLPLTSFFVDEVVEKENPDAVFAPFVESSGWRLIQRLSREGYWQEKSIEVIDGNSVKGYGLDATRQIRKAISDANLRQYKRVEVSSLEDAQGIPESLGGYPVALRSEEKNLTIIKNPEDFRLQVPLLLEESSEHKIFIEEFLSGWKEVSVGVLRDVKGNAKVIYTSENLVPVNIYAADCMSISPIQTLNRNQKQFVIGAALQLAKTIDGFVGYCNVQFAVDPGSGKILVSGVDFSVDHSADISLKSGCPLVKMVTKLVIGDSLNRLEISEDCFPLQKNDSQLLLKVPKFDLNEIESETGILGSYAKAKANEIYVGRNFCEVFRKALYQKGLEYPNPEKENNEWNKKELLKHLSKPYLDQLLHLYQALVFGIRMKEVEEVTNIDPRFLHQIALLVEAEQELKQQTLPTINKEHWKTLKLFGFSDSHIAKKLNHDGKGEQITESEVRRQREFYDVYPSIKCFGCSRNDIIKSNKKIMVLTAISDDNNSSLLQVPAFVLVKEAKQMGFDVVLINNDTPVIPFWLSLADHLYVEPLNWEIVYEIYRKENPSGIFIEANNAIPAELEERFSKMGSPIVKVPFELTSKMLNRNTA